jgi:hypothetical protein
MAFDPIAGGRSHTGGYHEIADDPGFVIEVEILDLADRAIGGADGAPFQILRVA